MTVGVDCPKCGISEGYYLFTNSLGYLVGKCYRAKCGHTGRVDGLEAALAGGPSKREPRHYTRPIEPLTGTQTAFLDFKFGCPEIALAVDGYNETDDRFILPVFGPSGYNWRGVIAYSLSGAIPKALTYNENPDEPWVHYARPDKPQGPWVIVEDWFSAEKVAAAGGVGVAILGTNLTQEMVTEIAEHSPGETFIALDRDAYAKTVGYVAKYREQFPRGLYAWSLRQDLKYETIKRIQEAFDGARNFIGDAKGASSV